MKLFAVGDDIPAHARQATGADPAELVAAGTCGRRTMSGTSDW